MRLADFVLSLVVVAQATEWQRLWSEGAREEAIEKLAAEITKAPGDAKLRLELVQYEVAVHRYVAALEHMQPLGDEVRALRGLALFRVADYANALTYLADDDVDGALMRIDALETLGRFADSDAALAAAGARGWKEDARILACDGRRLLRLGQAGDAANVFREAIAHDPWNGEAMFGLGRALMASGKRDEGLEVLKDHRELVPKLDRFDFARRSVDIAPRHAPNFTALGEAERDLGRLDRAELAYKTAASLANCAELVPNALRHARLLSDDRNDAKAAVSLLVSCAERCPDARLFVRGGDLKRRLSLPAEARALYERARKLRPDDDEIQKRIEQVKQ